MRMHTTDTGVTLRSSCIPITEHALRVAHHRVVIGRAKVVIAEFHNHPADVNAHRTKDAGRDNDIHAHSMQGSFIDHRFDHCSTHLCGLNRWNMGTSGNLFHFDIRCRRYFSQNHTRRIRRGCTSFRIVMLTSKQRICVVVVMTGVVVVIVVERTYRRRIDVGTNRNDRHRLRRSRCWTRCLSSRCSRRLGAQQSVARVCYCHSCVLTAS